MQWVAGRTGQEYNSTSIKFILDGRNTLTWNDGTTKVLDKDISAINFKKLNDLANTEGCSVNAVVSKLLKAYKQGKG